MQITKTSNSNFNQNTTFCSKYKPLASSFSLKKLEAQTDKISNDKNAKDIFTKLSLIAGSLVAEFSLFASENPDVMQATRDLINKLGLNKEADLTPDFCGTFSKQEQMPNITEKTNNRDFEKLFEEKPERNKYLTVTSHFPKLDAKYRELLNKSLEETDNNENNTTLDTIESIFEILTQDNSLKYHLSYFSSLNEKSDFLCDIAQNMISTITNGDTPMHYLVLLNNGKLSDEDIKKWAIYKNLGCDEFMQIKNFDNQIIKNLNNLKATNPNFKIEDIIVLESRTGNKNFAYKLQFSPKQSIREKFLTVVGVHEALIGPVTLKETIIKNNNYIIEDIQTELADWLFKDKRIDAAYNFARYIKPNAFKHINLSSDEVSRLEANSQKFREIKNICTKIIMKINSNPPGVQEFCDVLNDENIFGDLIKTRHGKIRFINRFILKDNPYADLKKDCAIAADILKNELENSLDDCTFFSYNNSAGKAPQFYHKSQLGNYIKVTINNAGSIHTIFEDRKKDPKQNSNNAQ